MLLHAQSGVNVNEVLSDSELIHLMDSTWRFINEDDPAMATPDYNDSNWIMIDPTLSGDSNIHLLNGIGWFRKKVYVPDSVRNNTLALNISHFGASEIYIDGNLLHKFGVIKPGADSTEYSNPSLKPLVFHFRDTGIHVIAIRYANYRTQRPIANDGYYHGFIISISEANSSILITSVIKYVLIGFFIALATIFATLAGLHFMLWLLRYSDLSNLFLSILCVLLFLYFLMQLIWNMGDNTEAALATRNTTSVLLSLALIVLSALLNYLFGKIGTRYVFIVVICITSMILTLVNVPYNFIISSLVLMIVMTEAVVLIITAIRKKVKAASALAVGILPVAFCTLIIFGVKIFMGNDVDTGNTSDYDGVTKLILIIFSLLLMIAFSGIPVSMSFFLAWRFARVNKDLSLQLTQVKDLSEKTQKQEEEKKRILENQKAELEKEVADRTSEIREEKKKSDDLLHNILPEEVASELKERGATTAHQYDQVTVLFTDFVAFTKAGERMGSKALVEELHNCFRVFDEIMEKYGIEKIKTIGDAYLAVCGLPIPNEQHAENVVRAAMEIIAFMTERRSKLGDQTFEIRIGVHSGEVVAGIVGVKKFAYDIWGDTVNTAARMEQSSVPGKINISQTTYELVQDKFACTYRGELEAKNKGRLKMYFIET